MYMKGWKGGISIYFILKEMIIDINLRILKKVDFLKNNFTDKFLI